MPLPCNLSARSNQGGGKRRKKKGGGAKSIVQSLVSHADRGKRRGEEENAGRAEIVNSDSRKVKGEDGGLLYPSTWEQRKRGKGNDCISGDLY